MPIIKTTSDITRVGILPCSINKRKSPTLWESRMLYLIASLNTPYDIDYGIFHSLLSHYNSSTEYQTSLLLESMKTRFDGIILSPSVSLGDINFKKLLLGEEFLPQIEALPIYKPRQILVFQPEFLGEINDDDLSGLQDNHWLESFIKELIQ